MRGIRVILAAKNRYGNIFSRKKTSRRVGIIKQVIDRRTNNKIIDLTKLKNKSRKTVLMFDRKMMIEVYTRKRAPNRDVFYNSISLKLIT